MGEDLDGLGLKELQSLEQQLDSALKQIRSRKVKLNYATLRILLVMWFDVLIELYSLNLDSHAEPSYV